MIFTWDSTKKKNKSVGCLGGSSQLSICLRPGSSQDQVLHQAPCSAGSPGSLLFLLPSAYHSSRLCSLWQINKIKSLGGKKTIWEITITLIKSFRDDLHFLPAIHYSNWRHQQENYEEPRLTAGKDVANFEVLSSAHLIWTSDHGLHWHNSKVSNISILSYYYSCWVFPFFFHMLKAEVPKISLKKI